MYCLYATDTRTSISDAVHGNQVFRWHTDKYIFHTYVSLKVIASESLKMAQNKNDRKFMFFFKLLVQYTLLLIGL